MFHNACTKGTSKLDLFIWQRIRHFQVVLFPRLHASNVLIKIVDGSSLRKVFLINPFVSASKYSSMDTNKFYLATKMVCMSSKDTCFKTLKLLKCMRCLHQETKSRFGF